MLKLQSSLKAACMAVAALTALGCSQDDLTGGAKLNGNTNIVASFEGAGASTRTSVNEANNVLWSDGDSFGLIVSKESKTSVSQFTCPQNGGGKTSATFTGTIESGATPSYAVYPYQPDMSIVATTITMKLPSEITYSAASNGPMYAPVTDIANNIQFKHLAGLLKIEITDIPANATKFIIEADKDIAGTCQADLNTSAPTLAITSDGSKKITVTFDQTSSTTRVFYIPIPAATYATLTATLVDNNGIELPLKKWFNATVARAGILTASFGYVQIDASTTSEVNDAIENALPQEEPTIPVTTYLEISNAIDASNGSTVEIPVQTNSNINLTLKEIPTNTSNAPLELKDKANSGNAPAGAVNVLTVAIPQTTTSNAPYLNISMPTTTVELAATESGTIYKKVVAKTATGTLIVKAGVTIEELVIAGGNVKVYGIVKKLVRADGNLAIIEVASYDAADIQEVTTPENFKFTATWDGTSKVAATGGNIFTAAHLANYQSATAPNSSNAQKLTPTITTNTTLFADINLASKPWLGMVIKNATFNGGSHKISNLNMSQYILSQTETTYTPEACVGLFAAVYGTTTVKDITLDKVTIRPSSEKSPKWVGSLVGYSMGTTTYENCIANEVDIYIYGSSSYRVGGLVGYIEGSAKDNDPGKVKFTKCEVNKATIAATFSYGGLVGSMYDSATFDECKTTDITLGLNDKPEGYGYVSKFIGDIANNNTNYNRTILIKNCITDDLTDAEKATLGFNKVIAEQGGSLEGTLFTGGCKWCGIVEPVVLASQSYTFTIKVVESGSEKTLVNGTDFNVCTK